MLDKGEEGWLKGELDGKEGVFPDNFVELIPLYEPSCMCVCVVRVWWGCGEGVVRVWCRCGVVW